MSTLTENTENTNKTDRFDRQNRVYGIEGTQKLQNGTVLIKGPLSDLTYEIAKNLALSGVNKILLCLDLDITNSDIQSTPTNNFQPGQIHMCSKSTLETEILKLNPYLKLSTIDSVSDDVYKLTNHIMVFINPNLADQRFMSDQTNSTNKIVSFWTSQAKTDSATATNSAKVLFNFFNDFKTHLITDTDGENYELIALGEVNKKSDSKTESKTESNSDTKSTYVLKTQTIHNLSQGNKVLIKLDHLVDPLEVDISKVINSHTFELCSDILDDKFVSYVNGYVCRQKEPMVLEHKRFDQNLVPSNFVSLHKLNPLIQNYFGAILSSEVIKAITNKYIPFNQSYEFEYAENIAFRPNSELQSKLSKLKCFMVGSGAIGCELLKNLVALGVATDSNKETNSYIKITDPDHIEVSNLSRQFLFRSENVGKSKSEVAAQRVKTFNPRTNIISYTEKLSADNQDFVNEHFAHTDIILNALDNVAARLYVDSQAVRLSKPLFESGTLGTKGNTQPVIPHITESYGASRDQEQEQSFPACTLKNFPSLIQHTIHWGMDDFDGLFRAQPQMLKQYMDAFNDGMNYSYLESLNQNETNLIKNNLYRLIGKLNSVRDLSDYIMWAYQLWSDRFVNRIKRLHKAHPIDSKTETDGKLFWSNGKKCPTIRQFSLDSPTDLNYLIATTKLLIQTYNKKADHLVISENEIITNILNMVKIGMFESVDISYSDDPDLFSDLETYPHQEQIHLDKIIDLSGKLEINPQEFEKDDDSNYHIMFVQSTSNARALNYSIPIASFYETKGIAGRIIPALATTTSIVASLILIEMLKYLENPTKGLELYSSSFINLADNMIIQSEPMPATVSETNGMKFTEWGPVPQADGKSVTFESSKDILLSDFIKVWSDKFNCEITMVLVGSKILYMQGSSEHNLNKKISELVTEIDSFLSIAPDDDETVLPEIKLVNGCDISTETIETKALKMVKEAMNQSESLNMTN